MNINVDNTQIHVVQHSVEELHVVIPPPSVAGGTTRQSAPVLLARKENQDQGASAVGAQGVQVSGRGQEWDHLCVIPILVEWMLSVKWEMIIQETQDQSVLVRKFIFKVYPLLSYYDTFSCIADTLNMKTDNVTHSDAKIK